MAELDQRIEISAVECIRSEPMKTLLRINTSIFGSGGVSSRLADAFVTRWRVGHPDATVIERDLASDPVPHLTAEAFVGFAAKPAKWSPAQRAAVAYSDTLIDELRRADVVVLGLPMYNFSVPSTLKAYFDHVARAGVTFRYTESGPVGLLTGKKAYVFTARGGAYTGLPADTETSYVRQFLSFLGIDDIEFVYAERLASGEASRTAAFEAALRSIDRLIDESRLAT